MTRLAARTVLGVAAIVGLGVGSLWVNVEQRLAVASIPAVQIQRDFTLCETGGGVNCVVDGDTIWIDGEKIRVADIDAPETHAPRCRAEAELGRRATLRL
jgi:endonuclease YncB( thermonuclease family)